MSKISLLWVDDEIDLLKPHHIYLEDKGYEVIGVTNGQDALDKVDQFHFDLVFLDENMPGLNGLEVLERLKAKHPELPVVMVTKNEAEDLMEQAIGSQITDYLIKPVKPQQIVLTLKKILNKRDLVRENTASAYQQEFRKIMMQLQEHMDHRAWVNMYKNLIRWELELEKSGNKEMEEILATQKQEANREFSKFVINNYENWLNEDQDAPIMSHTLLKQKVLPEIVEGLPTFLVVIDNLRLDQWRVIQPLVNRHFRLASEDTLFSILPTSTQYSRNAIFSGLMPSEIEKRYPHLWKNDDEQGGKNLFEAELLEEALKRENFSLKYSYTKVTNHNDGVALIDNMNNFLSNELNVIVYNFVDMLSHARTEMEVLKELASDEAAYRSLAESWFEHSPLFEALKKIEGKDINLIITTDHGTVRVKTPSRVIGDKKTTTNLRYKTGKNLNFSQKDVYLVRDPHSVYLPKSNVSSSYIFAKEDLYFVYPNNYNHYANYFNNTFQHGGISLEEVIIPVVKYRSR